MIPHHKMIFYFPICYTLKSCQMGVMQLKSGQGSDSKSYGAQVINEVRERTELNSQCSTEPLSHSLENIRSSIIPIMTSEHLPPSPAHVIMLLPALVW